MQYVIVIEKSDRNYAAYVPDLPGCVAVGESRPEVLDLIQEAVELHLAQMRRDGQPIPKATTTSDTVVV